MHRLFKTDFFTFEALRLLIFAAHEGGEAAELLAEVSKIKDANTERIDTKHGPQRHSRHQIWLQKPR